MNCAKEIVIFPVDDSQLRISLIDSTNKGCGDYRGSLGSLKRKVWKPK